METLEELLEKRKQIDAKIRELKGDSIVSGRFKIYNDVTNRSGWTLAAAVEYRRRKKTEFVESIRWQPIFKGKSKEHVLDELDHILEELKGLKA